MAQENITIYTHRSNTRKTIIYTILFIFITVVGLTYVKWYPFNKAILAAHSHSIGNSILGDHMNSPSVSWDSAWTYTFAYFQAVWKAAILGILLGSLVQVLLPAGMAVKSIRKNKFWQYLCCRNRLFAGYDVYLLCSTNCSGTA